jgi:hypothetical protein
MATNRILERESELALQKEVSYGADPGAVAGGDFFKHRPALGAIEHVLARVDRDQDADYDTQSVETTQLGRKGSNVRIEADVVPNGGAAPAEPDLDVAFENVMGGKHKGTAHTTTAAGTLTTNLKLAVGGVAASGVAAKDIVAVNVDATNGYEVRQVTALVGGGTPDDVTMCRALSANPAAAQAVKLGTTYYLDHTQEGSLYLKRFLGGTVLRDAVPGLILPQLEISWDLSDDTPSLSLSFTGEGKAAVAHTDARATPVTAGQPLVPDKCYAWFGANKFLLAGSGSLSINNGRALRKHESGSLEPTGVYRPNRYQIQLSLGLLLTTGDVDVSAIEAAVRAGTYQDVLLQFGTQAGTIFAMRLPKWLPGPPTKGAIQSEAMLSLSGGRAYAAVKDGEFSMAFI